MRGAFKGGFSSSSLDAATFATIGGQAVSSPVMSMPDIDSQTLLQQAHKRSDGWIADYNADAKSACPKTFAMFSEP
ncbi:hypothetical protein AYO22_04894 [Fonsecaea multimorphosa]|nr:hypothetical protein AYO22_04894 [Fonsecaea multimorphosa]